MSIIQAQTLFNRQAKTILDIVSMSKLYYYLICLNNRIFDILFNARVVIRRHCSWTVARAQQKRVSLFRYYVTSGLPRKRPVPTHTHRRLNEIRWRDLTRFWPRCPSVCLDQGEITARPDSRVSGGKSLRARHAKVTRPRRDGLFISGWK